MSTPFYFFGVRPGRRAGHFAYSPNYMHVDRLKGGDGRTPWAEDASRADVLSEVIVRDNLEKTGFKTEGDMTFLRKDGWTLLHTWDCSGDQRPGSNSIFAIKEDLTDFEMLAICRKTFLGVFVRLEDRLGATLRVLPDDVKSNQRSNPNDHP